MSRRTRNQLIVGLLAFVATVLLLNGPLWAAQFGAPPAEPAEPAKRDTPPSIKFESTVRVIQSTIAPDTWDDVGGEGSIEVVDDWGVAVISQTPDVHDQIENLLSTIRRVIAQQDGMTQAGQPSRPSIAERADHAERRDEIEELLAESVTIDFLETPLSEIVAVLEEEHGIEIEIDARSLDEIGLSTDTPITKRLSGISLRSALKLMLRDLGLTYLIEDEVLQITTPDTAETRLITKVYPIKDLATADISAGTR